MDKRVVKNGLIYMTAPAGKAVRYKPWIGDQFSFFYDSIMKNSIFPRKFNSDMNKHFDILKNELKGIHGNKIIELATGSGSICDLLNTDNYYTGVDISPRLLKIARKSFHKKGFENAEFYVTSVDNLQFPHNSFDFALCNLSLNFFPDIEKALINIREILKPESGFIGSVPVPERNTDNNLIRGTLLTEKELEVVFSKANFNFTALPYKNGSLLYFRAAANKSREIAY